MALDFSPLAQAVSRLDEIVALFRREPDNEIIRDAMIQRFEFSYDLAHKSLRRAISSAAASPDEIERMSFPTLIRTAGEMGLVESDWSAWHEFRAMRNLTSHTYDQAKAIDVARRVPAFLEEVRPLRDRLDAYAAR